MKDDSDKTRPPLVINTANPSARKSDGYLKAAGVTLAAGCAVLPFAVYLQRAEPVSAFKTSGQITDPLDRSLQKSFRHMVRFRPSEAVAQSEGVDLMTTATIMSNGKGLPGVGDAAQMPPDDQPFPKPVYRLRDVAGNLAMIEDDSGYWFVEKGSLLPDGSKLIAIRRTPGAGTWQITTSTGDMIDQSN